MLTFRIPIDPTNALHLYRHLLREASYLPLVARPWVVDQIRHRFHRHRSIPRFLPAQRTAHRRDAYYALRYLRGAVFGDATRMERILFMVFGRKGRRRRVLMDKFLKEDSPPCTPEDVQALIERRKKRPQNLSKWSRARQVSSIMDKWNLALLSQLAKDQLSQPAHPQGRLQSTLLKRHEPSYEKLNLWGKPHSPRRIRYIEARQWKVIASRVLPPVEPEEWDLLKRLATENKAVDPLLKIPRRRRKAAQSRSRDLPHWKAAKSDKTRPYDWRDTVTSPVDMLERQRNRRNRPVSGARRDGDPKGTPKTVVGKSGPLSLRTMRRLILRVWQLTPKISPHPSLPDRKAIYWGKVNKREKPVPRSQSAVDILFGDGVTVSGNIRYDRPEEIGNTEPEAENEVGNPVRVGLKGDSSQGAIGDFRS